MLPKPDLDDRDREIIAANIAALDAKPGPRVGDWVEFADGTTRRISYIWGDWPDKGVQTSAGGSWHLGDGWVSFSGSLYAAVPGDTLTDTGQAREGSAWIFHHNYATAGWAVDFTVPFRVFRSSRNAPPF